MPILLQDEDFQKLKQSLPTVFREQFLAEDAILAQAYPLLNLICPDRELLGRLQNALAIPTPDLTQDKLNQLIAIVDELTGQFQAQALFKYRLPLILSEFPIHSRAINHAIQIFNELIEAYHQGEQPFLAVGELEACYEALIVEIREHGPYCACESLWQLLGMMTGWSKLSPLLLLHKEFLLTSADQSVPPASESWPEISTLNIVELEQPMNTAVQNPFIPDYNYSINRAGRLASETNFLLLNAFGMKIGGHFDAQVKYPPHFIPVEQLHALIRRQLSHRMEVWPTRSFEYWLECSLHQLGLALIQKHEGDLSRDILVNPFFTKPLSFLSPEKIHSVLVNNLGDFASEELSPSESELNILSQYLFELLQAFQVNPGQALGIGANWDGTVNLSNEAGAQAFRFRDAKLGRRFKQLSLHRQGPSEAKMNAAIGIKFEAQSLLSNFDYMSQLQPSEYPEVIYNAIIDNLVTELFPEPAYFENVGYQKHHKQHVVRRTVEGNIQIDSFLQPSKQGTYFIGRGGDEKQTPMYRRAGTLDVQAFPKNSTCSEQSRNCYAGNPLGPLQLQHAQAMHGNARGHIVYDPLAPDQFLEDAFFGQVTLSDNGDYLPFIGVIPKNFDRHFNQDNELCASFVIRMLQSARIMEYCPSFRNALKQMKTHFLPALESQPPLLPSFCSDYLIAKLQSFGPALASVERTFSDCHKIFYSLFKNLIYSLYEHGRADEHFRHNYLSFIHSRETFYPASKARCEKLIRDLTINKPVYLPSESLARYDEILNYLAEITAYFYPKATDALAQEIARQARHQLKPLLGSPAIKNYFTIQKQNKQSNLSRKQTPGMLHSALKHAGPSTSIAHDYHQMHKVSFPSYYRDPDGTSCGEPQLADRLIDGGAKTLGACLQVMHRYHLFAAIHKPLSAPYLYAKERAAVHQQERLKPLWAAEGAIEGLFIHGIALGLLQTASTPFQMLADFFGWQYQRIAGKNNRSLVNPLAIPAAPANESNLRSDVSANSRDYLLDLLGKPGDSEFKKNEILAYTLQLTKNLYPYLNAEDLILYQQKLQESFPLNEEECKTLFNPLLEPAENEALATLLQRYNTHINKNLIQAVFRCLTHPSFAQQGKVIIKQTQSFFSLNKKQNELLIKLLNLYQRTPMASKQHFLRLFRFNGTIHQALKIRDQLLQLIQSVILKVFDEQELLELLMDLQIDQLILALNSLTMETILNRLPNSMKGPLKLLLSTNDLDSLDEYYLSEKQIELLIKIQQVFNQVTEPAAAESLLSLCHIRKTGPQNLSVKEGAHNKLTQFTERELKHQLLGIEETKDLFTTFSSHHFKKSPALQALIAKLEDCFVALHPNNDESINQFYDTACEINNTLQKNNRIKEVYCNEAQSLLCNFVDVSMNALVNSRLMQVDIFNTKSPENPLLTSIAIINWLTELQKFKPDLHSSLKQQVEQSPSLDHTLWGYKCILQVLERQNPSEKIRKTRTQSLLRFWIQHKDNVTLTGERYINPSTGEANRSPCPNLFQDSLTMQHALNRVQEKLPGLSIFSLSRKVQSFNSEQEKVLDGIVVITEATPV